MSEVATSLPRGLADDLHIIVLLWQEQRTRDAALALADRNRKAAGK